MSVYIDVWHRTHPLTPEDHHRFLDYYGEFVVAPPSDFFEVVAGFRYLEGPSNEDFALYRYESMASIEESMLSFGAEPAFVAATEALFSEVDIEETRGIAMHLPYAPEERLDAALVLLQLAPLCLLPPRLLRRLPRLGQRGADPQPLDPPTLRLSLPRLLLELRRAPRRALLRVDVLRRVGNRRGTGPL